MLFCHRPGSAQLVLPEALVRPEGEPAVLQGAPVRARAAGRAGAGGLQRAALRVGRALRLLRGLERVSRGRRPRVQARRRGPVHPGELAQSPALGQPRLPAAPTDGPGGSLSG